MSSLREWWTERKKRKYEKYVEERGWIEEKTLERLRQQQSPLRSARSAGRRR